MQDKHLMPIIEAMLFSKPSGFSSKEIAEKLNETEEKINAVLIDIWEHYNSEIHGIELETFEGKYRFTIKNEIKSILNPKPRTFSLTESQFEILAILLLNGPSSVTEIEKSRGKSSYNQVKKLLEMGLIIKKRKENTKNRFVYVLSDMFFELLPEKTINELRGAKIDKTSDISPENR
ncbi:SMC-Scp complex subunit ScpB [Marinitoga litoralis]|uniref:SMC-Scp complex subunit ScpB n=1 Tax=Marinitoga litoralis TaxID=570855 RepID=UPI00195FEB37|nr:SMC-Scp complex subunit ScpB [Marinitoga litoralis]MBM7560193.1 segregation and condensation protein B [Marinitoga litoralis]